MPVVVNASGPLVLPRPSRGRCTATCPPEEDSYTALVRPGTERPGHPRRCASQPRPNLVENHPGRLARQGRRSMKLRHPLLIRGAAFLAAGLVRGWMSTVRYRIENRDTAPHPAHPRHGRFLYAFWHEALL